MSERRFALNPQHTTESHLLQRAQNVVRVVVLTAVIGGAGATITGLVRDEEPKTPEAIALDKNTVSTNEELQRWGLIGMFGSTFVTFVNEKLNTTRKINNIRRKTRIATQSFRPKRPLGR